MYYNAAVTPNVDTAVVAGVRLYIRL